ncbi:amino acid:proton antiporter [Anaerolineaceae bacterium oral taxon 439]|nr:amino acid:proton antiporter [Anaerolineaceae bacterium oral taxon 439]
MNKKFNLGSVILSVICVVFVAEAAAPVAAIGNSQFFWWLFMIIAFLLPYGLISSELGTTYQGEGGLYDWIHQAFPGTRWGARASWWYWLNFPLWMASLAVMCPELITIATGIEIGIIPSALIQLAFVWIVTLIAFYPVCDNIVILNVSAVIKVVLALLVGGMGLYFGLKNGFANDMSLGSFLPSFNLDSLSYISVIIFNMLGFEVICTFSEDMQNPKKQIPQAIVIGGLAIAAIYLIGGSGIGAAIPTSEISVDSGLLDAVMLISGTETGIFISLVALLFLVTLFGNMISWSMGVNSTAAYAADNGDMPKFFTRRWSKNDMPIGSALMNGIVASGVILLGVIVNIVAPDSQLFWSFFALNLVLLLLSYVPVFPAFLKLRETDPDTERPIKVPGGPVMLKLMAYVPIVLIAISIFFTAVPLSFDSATLATVLPITIGAIISIIFGEVLIGLRERKESNVNRTDSDRLAS